MKKEYSAPEFLFCTIEIRDVILGSPENFSSYVDPNPGSWDDPTIDPDDGSEIGW